MMKYKYATQADRTKVVINDVTGQQFSFLVVPFWGMGVWTDFNQIIMGAFLLLFSCLTYNLLFWYIQLTPK